MNLRIYSFIMKISIKTEAYNLGIFGVKISFFYKKATNISKASIFLSSLAIMLVY